MMRGRDGNSGSFLSADTFLPPGRLLLLLLLDHVEVNDDFTVHTPRGGGDDHEDDNNWLTS
jgi:hypothetical protein